MYVCGGCFVIAVKITCRDKTMHSGCNYVSHNLQVLVPYVSDIFANIFSQISLFYRHVDGRMRMQVKNCRNSAKQNKTGRTYGSKYLNIYNTLVFSYMKHL